MAVAAHQVKPLQLWAGRIGHAFLILASLVTGAAGWIFGGGTDHVIMAAILAAVFALCPWAVAYLLPFASIARQSGRPGVAAAMMVGVFIAGLMELRGELMIFAGKRAASSTEATLQKTRYEDARKAVEGLERDLAGWRKRLDEQAPYGTSESYSARIKEAEALAAREASAARKGCRQKCDEALKVAADLRAKQAIALDRETKTEPEILRLTAALDEARKTAATTKAGDSMTVAEAETLASLWTVSLNPSADAKRWADLMAGLFMAIFLLVVPTTLIYASKIDWDAPKQRHRRNGTIARLMAWLKGEPLPKEPDAPIAQSTPNVARETVNTTATVSKPQHMRLGDAAALVACMKAAA